MLPGRSGLEILATMRQHGLRTPVLMLTARDAIEDRVRGLDTGADDYLVKPLRSPNCWLASARCAAGAFRRPARDCESGIWKWTLSAALSPGRPDARSDRPRVRAAGIPGAHQGHVVSREMLTRDVWKEAGRHTPLDNVIDVHVARLRRKVDEQFDQKLVHTVRGVGFVVREERE